MTLSENIERKFIESFDITDWEIYTDTGWQSATSIHKTVEYDVWELETETGLKLRCADDHILFLDNFQEIFVKDLIPNQSRIITKNGLELVISVENLNYTENMYDIEVDSEDHRYYSNGILSHNTTTSVGFMIWATIFQEMYSIAITANKRNLAIEVLSRYQLAYENLPMWIQQGVVEWNKGKIELENGSKIIAAATSASSIRGGSFNCVYMDELAHVHNNLAEEFFTSTYPVISSGKTTKIIITSTPRGCNLFYKMWMDAVTGKNGYNPIDVHWSEIPGRDEIWKEKTIANSSPRQFAQEFSCDFLGSSNTLIEGTKLQGLYAKDSLDEVHGMEIYEYPIKEDFDIAEQKLKNKDHFYVICVDVSQGKNLDYSAFSVFDCSSIPYKQVATYRNNSIAPLLLPDVIKTAAIYYNNAYVLVEINSNPHVVDSLIIDLEYENVFRITTGNKLKQTLSESSKATQNGLNMSGLVKRVGCTTLKTLIETNKLDVLSADTIYELTTFVMNKGSFAAEEGSNDDLVMTLVMFSWLSTQKMFIEMAASDIRKTLQIENNYAKADEDIYDYPADIVITSGLEKNFIVMGGDVWEEVSTNYESFW